MSERERERERKRERKRRERWIMDKERAIVRERPKYKSDGLINPVFKIQLTFKTWFIAKSVIKRLRYHTE